MYSRDDDYDDNFGDNDDDHDNDENDDDCARWVIIIFSSIESSSRRDVATKLSMNTLALFTFDKIPVVAVVIIFDEKLG